MSRRFSNNRRNPNQRGQSAKTERAGRRSHGAREGGGGARAHHEHRDSKRSAISQEELVMGRNCLRELLRHNPSRLREVYFAESREDAAAPSDGKKVALRDEVVAAGVPVRVCRREELDVLVRSESHQGVVARVSAREFISLDELVSRVSGDGSARILALDGVLDPQNFGAVLRAAECFGVTAVVWSKNRGAPLGPVVSKASVGASELVPLCPVGNLHRALETLKRVGVWSVGAMVSSDATTINDLDVPRKWILVMGSEGEGIQRLIEESLDFRVYIPMLGEVSSLNVSQATAVMLHSLVSRIDKATCLK